MGALHVVAEGEEGVGAQGHASLGGDPGGLLLAGEDLGPLGEPLLPLALGQHVVVLVGDVDVDRVVAVGATDAVGELEPEHLGVLAQVPGVGLVACEARAVDAALLAGAHADGLAVLHVADGVGLRVLERDQAHDHVDLGVVGDVLVLGHDVGQQVAVDPEEVVPLLEGDAEDVLGLLGAADVVGVDLDDVVGALLLLGEDLERLGRVAGGDDAVGDLVLDVAGGARVAGLGEGRPVAVGAHAVGAAGADVGAGDRRELALVIHEVDLLVRLGERPAHGGAGGRDMLERGRRRHAGRLLELAHELPGVEGVEEVDVAGTALQHLDREVGAVPHEDARGLLVGVHAVLELELVHVGSFLGRSLAGWPRPP